MAVAQLAGSLVQGRHAGFRRVTGAGELAFPDYDGTACLRAWATCWSIRYRALHCHDDKPKRLRVKGARG